MGFYNIMLFNQYNHHMLAYKEKELQFFGMYAQIKVKQR